MKADIFEVIPKPQHHADYLSIAAELLPTLEQIEGFISVERFESLSQKGKLLSLSFWEDEQAIRRWREQLDHQNAQQAGRFSLFETYRLRVASVSRDYGPHARDEAPQP